MNSKKTIRAGLSSALLLLGIVLAGCTANGVLMPLSPTSTPPPEFNIAPELVAFDELQEDPAAYRDKVIRVSGEFERLPLPPCFPHSGPGARWSLVADSLRLDIVGFDELLHIVEEPAIFTIDGVFRLYNAPLGCGKEPEVDSAWYLEALNVVEPNPLIVARTGGELAMSGVIINSLGTPTPLAVVTATSTPVATATPFETDVHTATPTPTSTGATLATLELTPTPSATNDRSLTPTITRKPAGTGTPGTATPTATGQTPTASVTPSATPSLAPTDSGVPLPTATTGEGGGYLPPPTFDPYP